VTEKLSPATKLPSAVMEKLVADPPITTEPIFTLTVADPKLTTGSLPVAVVSILKFVAPNVSKPPRVICNVLAVKMSPSTLPLVKTRLNRSASVSAVPSGFVIPRPGCS